MLVRQCYTKSIVLSYGKIKVPILHKGMIEMSDTTIGVSNDVKSRLERVKVESGQTYDEVVDDLLEQNLDIDIEDLDEYAVEKHERVEKTRATVVGILEALNEADMIDEAVELIESLTQPSMLTEHREVVDYLIEKSKNGQDVNEVDRLLARMVIETEGSRETESPAAEIARGLFTDTTIAERSTKQQSSVETSTRVVDEEPPSENDGQSDKSIPTVSTGKSDKEG